MAVSEPEGLEDHQVREVKENIACLTQEMLGDEMALQVAQNVSQMLADYNKAKRGVSQKKDYSSLHEAALEEQRLRMRQKMAPEEEAENEDMSGLVTNFFSCFLLVKKSLICLEGRSMTSCRGDTILFCSSQQLPRLRLGPLKGFLSGHGASRAVDSLRALLHQLQRNFALGLDI